MISAERYQAGKELLRELIDVYISILEEGNEKYKEFETNIEMENFKASSQNFFYYLSLRTKDITSIQSRLIPWGLSSLGRLEGKTLPTLKSVIRALASILNISVDIPSVQLEDFYRGDTRLEKNTEIVFGPKPKSYRTRIMVTLPEDAGKSKNLIPNLVKNDMNVARINCSHGDETLWLQTIQKIREEERKQKKNVKILLDLPGSKIRNDWIYTTYENPRLTVGDVFKLVKSREHLDFDTDLKLQTGVLNPAIFKHISPGDPVFFDDGDIEAQVQSVDENGAVLLVKKAKNGSVRLKSKKGVNLPLTELEVSILPEEDKHILKFAAQHGDIIGCSFVRGAEDIRIIQDELQAIAGEKAKEIILMAKMETVSGVDNLPEIILQGNAKNPFCVMIARGDLAVESGYSRLGELQQEIMWLCEAANVPVIWATEVLSSMVKSGVPTRAEITDATLGTHAECVMLNKGEYQVEGIQMLKDIFIRMQEHQYKKTAFLRALNIAELK